MEQTIAPLAEEIAGYGMECGIACATCIKDFTTVRGTETIGPAQDHSDPILKSSPEVLYCDFCGQTLPTEGREGHG